jgi:hypothetical protein
MSETVREKLAALAHEQWAGWMRYMFEQSIVDSHGQLIVPAPLLKRWQRQAGTPYRHLPEEEKESDRTEADRVIAALGLNPHLPADYEPPR